MAKKKVQKETDTKRDNPNVIGLRAEVSEQPIVDTLEVNYMPYAMSVIMSRAIPEIDGFKPSHRKLLYTMYEMGLLTGKLTKSANIVGQTMHLNPHGDAAIYDTMVRLSKGYEALLTPFVESKGNFGKYYSKNMAYAASRYTEAKLAPICSELFADINSDTVDFVDNYDSTTKEPVLLPTTFPNVLVSANMGIAVGMASQICGFNISEVCRTTIECIKNPDHDIMTTLLAPDFPTGGELIYNVDEIAAVYKTGRGNFKVRSRWRYVKEDNLIEVYEIPYSTCVEAIIDKVVELVKGGKIREISDIRDETDLSGLKIAIDLKRGTDPDKLMQKLFKTTPLMDSYACNFNILIAGMPRVMGVREIIDEWTAWREDCIRRRVFFELGKKKERMHLLRGLESILLDIDKAIDIIRNTELESEVIENLMIGFGIDKIQAEYVADIKLRNINREYILKRTDEIAKLAGEIEELQSVLDSKSKRRKIIVRELENVIKKYDMPRKTGIVYEEEIDDVEVEELPPEYPVTVFVSREGYLKKITPQSLKMNSEQKYKEGDSLLASFECTSRAELIVFTDKCVAYKLRMADFDDTKASALGTYIKGSAGMEDDENIISVIKPGDYKGFVLFFYENGKAAKVDVNAYATKTNRKKLVGAFYDKVPVAAVLHMEEDDLIAAYSTDNRAMVFSSALLAPKTSRATQGVQIMTLKKKAVLDKAVLLTASGITNSARYKVRSIPAAGAIIKEEDSDEKQLSLL